MSIHNVNSKFWNLWQWLLPPQPLIQPCTEKKLTRYNLQLYRLRILYILCECNSKIELSTIVYSSSLKTTKNVVTSFPVTETVAENERNSFIFSECIRNETCLLFLYLLQVQHKVRSFPYSCPPHRPPYYFLHNDPDLGFYYHSNHLVFRKWLSQMGSSGTGTGDQEIDILGDCRKTQIPLYR